MQPSLIFVVVLALGFTSCTTSLIYSDAGHKYTLSREDVAEINGLIAPRRDIRKPLGVVWMKGPDSADVSSGDSWQPLGEITVFTIHKKKGRWMIDESSVRQDHAMVTS
jgi:hypothetical protein